DQQFDESTDVGVLVEQPPVEPRGLVVVTVVVVIAVLGAPHFVAHQGHGSAEREERQGQEILYLTVPERLDRAIVRWAFHAAVPAPVVIGAVAIVLAVPFIVLAVIGHEVIECKAVVARDEIDALLGLPFLVRIEIRTAEKAFREKRHGVVGAAKEIAYV